MKQRKIILIISLVTILIASVIIYFLLQTKNQSNNWVTMNGKYFEMKVPSNFGQISPNDGSIITKNLSEVSTDYSDFIGTEDGKQTVFYNVYTKDNIDTSNTNGDIFQVLFGNEKYTEVKLGNTIFQKIDDTYIIRLNNNSVLIYFTSNDNTLLPKILETVKIH